MDSSEQVCFYNFDSKTDVPTSPPSYASLSPVLSPYHPPTYNTPTSTPGYCTPPPPLSPEAANYFKIDPYNALPPITIHPTLFSTTNLVSNSLPELIYALQLPKGCPPLSILNEYATNPPLKRVTLDLFSPSLPLLTIELDADKDSSKLGITVLDILAQVAAHWASPIDLELFSQLQSIDIEQLEEAWGDDEWNWPKLESYYKVLAISGTTKWKGWRDVSVDEYGEVTLRAAC